MSPNVIQPCGCVETDHYIQHCEKHWWTDGNGGCDCNRSLYLNREYGLNLGEKDDWDDVPCLPCGDTIRLLSVTVGGVQQWPTKHEQ